MELDQEIGRMWIEGTRAERWERSEHKVLYLVIKSYCSYYFLEVRHLRKSTLLLTFLFLCSSIFRAMVVKRTFLGAYLMCRFWSRSKGGVTSSRFLTRTQASHTVRGRKRRGQWNKNAWMAFTDSMDIVFEQTPGDGEGQGSLACCSLWGRKESQLSNWTTKPNLEKYCLGADKWTDS